MHLLSPSIANSIHLYKEREKLTVRHSLWSFGRLRKLSNEILTLKDMIINKYKLLTHAVLWTSSGISLSSLKSKVKVS